MIAATVHHPNILSRPSRWDSHGPDSHGPKGDSSESILAISSDLIYGEIVKHSYGKSDTSIYYIPSFTTAIGIVSILEPHTVILDLYQEDFVEAELFLRQLASLKISTSAYQPSFFLSESSLAKIEYRLNGYPFKHQIKYQNRRFHQQKDLLFIELSRIEVLNHIRACLGWSNRVI